MPIPLLLGLGLLAGNQLFAEKRREARDADISERYRGLLGVAPGQMGPPDEAGGMGGGTRGNGLLADPMNPQSQMAYASGVMGIPGQRENGIQLLNAAMQRAQQMEQARRQDQQWERQFGLQQQQFNQGQQNFERNFQAAATTRRKVRGGLGLGTICSGNNSARVSGNSACNSGCSRMQTSGLVRQRMPKRTDCQSFPLATTIVRHPTVAQLPRRFLARLMR